MNKLAIVILLILGLALAGCASPERKITIRNEAEDISGEAVIAPSREAVYIYGNQRDLPKTLILRIGGEPVLLPSGYLRLAGVVSGEKPTACLEIAGGGLALGEGETIDAYRIIRIASDHVVLEK
ncbi:hypothetical protein A2625_05345 [candidate division WOR-1 bacterium RIFCSPHIGHO2_01_FULL_53_15]|uniref:Lipoprotein n=1 Tax=candidate division WOR-1 bacterium RIFCSPHIGHO2_01_FULL_53_15 TaxID=1802564 RepID=A0A1F4Q1Z8_UNCSA|nr:MAG: hypothetical protein A2625_05345 [candidate division WOR-1 bacterium RIFCSPHIGHO2_01_FULL_53_15]OGC13094.1 MAG: hypothetical protein A3D23_00290 [candidate division WOR-1 bacterium RIFCSPHIGHO2_02_FULL_53_26]